MTDKNTGGPAFPWGAGFAGMTLRDYFAAKAMQAMLTNHILHEATMKIANEARIAEEAALAQMSFIAADAMMEARND
jgi:hypothetical protein